VHVFQSWHAARPSDAAATPRGGPLDRPLPGAPTARQQARAVHTEARRHRSSRALPRGEAQPAAFRRHPPRSLCTNACTEAPVTERSSAVVHLLAPLDVYLDLGGAQSVASILADLAPFDAAVYVDALGVSARSSAASLATRRLYQQPSRVTRAPFGLSRGRQCEPRRRQGESRRAAGVARRSRRSPVTTKDAAAQPRHRFGGLSATTERRRRKASGARAGAGEACAMNAAGDASRPPGEGAGRRSRSNWRHGWSFFLASLRFIIDSVQAPGRRLGYGSRRRAAVRVVGRLG
jgi:hypothetical protein